jgi:serine/threonine-protein kinase RsbW
MARFVKRTSGVTLASSFTRVHVKLQGPTNVVRLSIPALLSFRDLALSAVLAALDAEADVVEDTRGEIVSAVSEAFNNVVVHAYSGVRGGQIDLHVEAKNGELEIHLFDRGRGFQLEDVPVPDLDALPESGMGLFIMRSFMDDVTYIRGGGTTPNVLILRKRWSPPALAESAMKKDGSVAKKETSQSGWRMRSVAVPMHAQSTAGSLKRK